jgi:undecaprenyl-diphosphatase
MTEALHAIDTALFFFVNSTISTPATDLVWPVLTDYSNHLAVRIILLGVWVLLVVRGGKRGRTAAILCVVVLVASDQLSSFVIKPLVDRARPCHEAGGVPVLQGIHLLVHCGSGKSFPSSHAVNNFAMAMLFSYYYRKWAWAFFAWAALIAVSRVAVGVHYPSDVAGGALIGAGVALAIIIAWTKVQQRYIPRWTLVTAPVEPRGPSRIQNGAFTS